MSMLSATVCDTYHALHFALLDATRNINVSYCSYLLRNNKKHPIFTDPLWNNIWRMLALKINSIYLYIIYLTFSFCNCRATVMAYVRMQALSCNVVAVVIKHALRCNHCAAMQLSLAALLPVAIFLLTLSTPIIVMSNNWFFSSFHMYFSYSLNYMFLPVCIWCMKKQWMQTLNFANLFAIVLFLLDINENPHIYATPRPHHWYFISTCLQLGW